MTSRRPVLIERRGVIRTSLVCLLWSSELYMTTKRKNMLMCLHLKVCHYDFNIKIYCICFISYKSPLFWTHIHLARGPRFDTRPRHLKFERLVISCFQVAIWLKYCWSDVNPQYNQQPTILISDWPGKRTLDVLNTTLFYQYSMPRGL